MKTARPLARKRKSVLLKVCYFNTHASGYQLSGTLARIPGCGGKPKSRDFGNYQIWNLVRAYS